MYAHEQGCNWTQSATESAALHGNLQTLTYLYENGCTYYVIFTPKLTPEHSSLLGPWGANTCNLAAKENNLACLTYAHEHGAPWAPDVCTAAAKKGSLECLKYAHENGSAFSGQTPEAAAQSGSLACLQYVLENGEFTLKSELYNQAAKAGSLECMKYLHEKNCPVGKEICHDAIPSLECLKFAFEVLHAPLDRNVELENAAYKGSEECLIYLLEKGLKWPTCYEKWGYWTETFAEVALAQDGLVRQLKLALKYKCTLSRFFSEQKLMLIF